MRLSSTRSFWNVRIFETEVAYKVSLFISAELILAVNARGSACSYIAKNI